MKIQIQVPGVVYAAERKDERNAEVGRRVDRFTRALADHLRNAGHNAVLDRVDTMGNNDPHELDPETTYFVYHTRGVHPRLIHYKHGYLPDTYYVDREGYGLWSSLMHADDFVLVTEDEAEETHEKLYEQYVRNGVSKYAQNDTPFEEPEFPFFFVPAQVCKDETIQAAGIDMRQFLTKVVTNLVTVGFGAIVKPHPKEKSKRSNQTIDILTNKFSQCSVTNANIHTILSSPLCLGTICVNSGVGFETLLHAKPVFTAGPADYAPAAYRISLSDMSAIGKYAYRHTERAKLRQKKWLAYCANHYFVHTDRPDTFERVEKLLESD